MKQAQASHLAAFDLGRPDPGSHGAWQLTDASCVLLQQEAPRLTQRAASFAALLPGIQKVAVRRWDEARRKRRRHGTRAEARGDAANAWNGRRRESL